MASYELLHRGKRYEIRRRQGALDDAEGSDAPVVRGYITELLRDMSSSPLGLAALSDAVRDDLSGALPPWYDSRSVVEHMTREINAGRYVLVQTSRQPAVSKNTSALTTYKGTHIVGKPALVDVQFVGAMDKINAYASKREVKLHITSSFRRPGQKLKRAVVTPAKRSNHFAGHAIDMNVVCKGTTYNSEALKIKNHDRLPEAVRGFIQDIRDDGSLRWGGDFGEEDPVHIDDHLNRDEQAWIARFNACQKAR
jgi:hypothetical protein